MKKKLLSLVLTLCMLCSSCVVLGTTAFAAASTPTADDGALTAEALTFADTQGEGTININGATDWAKFVEAAQTLDFAGVVIKLNADITYNEGMTATEITAATDTSGYTKWTSIPKFSGTFDGGEHTISGLYVLGDGFISDLMGGATVQNVTFSNCYVKDVPSTVLWNCGLVAARATGSAGQTVTLSHVTVESSSVSSDQWSASGMIGEVCYVSVNAEYCTNGANVSNTQTVNKTAHSAGIVCGGANAGPITLDHCINTGTISSVSTRNWANQSSGGLVAYAKTTVLMNTGKLWS